MLLAGSLLVGVVAAAPSDSETSPDMEFLEFLGSWQTRDGHWVDPLQVDDLLPPGELERNSRDRPKKPKGQEKDRRSSDVPKEPAHAPDENPRVQGPER